MDEKAIEDAVTDRIALMGIALGCYMLAAADEEVMLRAAQSRAMVIGSDADVLMAAIAIIHQNILIVSDATGSANTILACGYAQSVLHLLAMALDPKEKIV
jgi:hypothetical protein